MTKKTTNKEAIMKATKDVTSASHMAAEPESMALTDAVFAYAAIQSLENVLDARKKRLAEFLKEQAKLHGKTVGEKGSLELTVAGSKVVNERKTAKVPDPEGLKALIKEKGLELSAAFDEISLFEVNPSKVQYLVDTGALDAADVETLKKVSYALRVTPSPEVKKVLEEVVPPPKSP